VLWDTALQQHIPRDRLSRVAAWDQLGSFVAIPIGLTIVGPIAAAIGVTEALLLFTLVVLVPNALVLLSRDVRTLRRVEAAGPPPALPPRMHPQTDSVTETAVS
jgi:hypothetical protein